MRPPTGLPAAILAGVRRRRAVRSSVVAGFGRGGSLRHGYGRGLIVQHFTLWQDASPFQAFCGARVEAVSDRPFPDRPLRCPACVSVVGRILARAAVQDTQARRSR